MAKLTQLEKQYRAIAADQLFELHNQINKIIGGPAIAIAKGELPVKETVLRIRKEIILATEHITAPLVGD